MERLSPRKTQNGRVPRWIYRSRGRRTKAILQGPYGCPQCGNLTLTIKIYRDSKTVEAKCSCGFSKNLDFRPIFQPVDYYGRLIDQYYKHK